jgi:hypothetical protein
MNPGRVACLLVGLLLATSSVAAFEPDLEEALVGGAEDGGEFGKDS